MPKKHKIFLLYKSMARGYFRKKVKKNLKSPCVYRNHFGSNVKLTKVKQKKEKVSHI